MTRTHDYTTTIDPRQLERLRARGDDVRLLDVRTPGEFRRSHIEGAHHLPLDRLAPYAGELAGIDAPLVLVCRSDARARSADAVLRQAGARRPLVLEGGMLAWRDAGLPVRSRPMPMPELVRRAVGALGIIAGAVTAGSNPVLAMVLVFFGLRLGLGQSLLPCAIAGACATEGSDERSRVDALVAGRAPAAGVPEAAQR